MLGIAIGVALPRSGEQQPTATQNKLVAQAMLEPPRTCEAEPPGVIIPSLTHLQSIPRAEAHDVLSATGRQFQDYRRFLNCLNEQIEFDKAGFRNGPSNSPATAARASGFARVG